MRKNNKSNSNGKYSIFAAKGILKIVIVILLVVVLIRIATYVHNTAYLVFSDKPNITTEKKEFTLTVEEGMDVDRIAEILEINGIIRDKSIFKIQAKLAKLEKTLQLGSHKLSSFMSAEDIIENLSQPGASN